MFIPFFSLIKNTKTISNCNICLFTSFKAITQIILLFHIDTNYQSLNLTQNSYKRTDLAQLFSLDQIDHGTIFRWPCISKFCYNSILALSLVIIFLALSLPLLVNFLTFSTCKYYKFNTKILYWNLSFISDSPSTKQQSFYTPYYHCM